MYQLPFIICNQYLIISMSVCPISAQQSAIVTVKLLLLGESSVGKTSLVNRYTNHTFEANHNLLTIGIEVKKIMKFLAGRRIRLELWDTAGQEKHRSLPSNYFRGIQGILLVYDITSGESFLRVEDWFKKVNDNCLLEKITITLVGNKVDLQSQREVRSEQAESFAEHHEMKFQQTSAKTSKGVQQLIQSMLREILLRGEFESKKETINITSSIDNSQSEQTQKCC